MPPSIDALTTAQAVKTYLQITGDAHDDLLESLVEAVSAHFKAYTGRNLTARDYSPDPQSQDYDPDNALLDGSGYPDLLLPQYPVIELAQLTVDGQVIPPAQGPGQDGFLLDRSAGLVSLAARAFPRAKANVALVYRAGFEAIPPDLAQAAVEQTAARFQESAAGQGRLGLAARALADGSVSYTTSALLPQVAAVLDRYRSRSLL